MPNLNPRDARTYNAAETRDTSSLHGQHKIISDGKIIAVAAGKTKNRGF